MIFKNNKLNTKLDIWPTGYQFWFENEKIHRIGNPAYIHYNGYCEWLQNGKYHRTDGPARILPDGEEEWHQNGIIISK